MAEEAKVRDRLPDRRDVSSHRTNVVTSTDEKKKYGGTSHRPVEVRVGGGMAQERGVEKGGMVSLHDIEKGAGMNEIEYCGVTEDFPGMQMQNAVFATIFALGG